MHIFVHVKCFSLTRWIQLPTQKSNYIFNDFQNLIVSITSLPKSNLNYYTDCCLYQLKDYFFMLDQSAVLRWYCSHMCLKLHDMLQLKKDLSAVSYSTKVKGLWTNPKYPIQLHFSFPQIVYADLYQYFFGVPITTNNFNL